MGPLSATSATDSAYFESLYAGTDDPWDMKNRWYERRKRELLGAMLPRERYTRAFEPGCGNGLFTLVLAHRCAQVVASDLSAVAVQSARTRLASHVHVDIQQGSLPENLPDGQFDLIVVGELGYYFDLQDWRNIATALIEKLSGDGVLLACHWKAPFDARRSSTKDVHDVFHQSPALHAQCRHDESDFIAEIWTRSAASIATQEKLR